MPASATQPTRCVRNESTISNHAWLRLTYVFDARMADYMATRTRSHIWRSVACRGYTPAFANPRARVIALHHPCLHACVALLCVCVRTGAFPSNPYFLNHA